VGGAAGQPSPTIGAIYPARLASPSKTGRAKEICRDHPGNALSYFISKKKSSGGLRQAQAINLFPERSASGVEGFYKIKSGSPLL